jgi:hypothetical protein
MHPAWLFLIKLYFGDIFVCAYETCMLRALLLASHMLVVSLLVATCNGDGELQVVLFPVRMSQVRYQSLLD